MVARDRSPKTAGARLVDAVDLIADAYAPVAVSGDSPVVQRRPRRAHGHPHTVAGDFYRVEGSTLPTLPKMTAEIDPRGTQQHRDAIEQNLALLPPGVLREEDEIYDELIERGADERTAAEQAHRELAAPVLAVGGTNEEAADRAGVAPSTIARYLKDDDFKQAVATLREQLTSRVTGRILQRLEKLTDAEHIEGLKVDDLLHIYDRTGGAKSPSGIAASRSATTVNVGFSVQQYNEFLATLPGSDTGNEGEDFETYGAGVVPVPGGGSFREGTVPRLGRGETSGED